MTIWQEQQRRRSIIEEFFRAYHKARHANKVFAERHNPEPVSKAPAQPPPACLVALGLTWPCTGQEVKHAFRMKAKVVHPDTGGSSEAFQTLHRAYKEALALVSRPLTREVR
jgi:hypothetical protein